MTEGPNILFAIGWFLMAISIFGGIVNSCVKERSCEAICHPQQSDQAGEKYCVCLDPDGKPVLKERE